MKKKKKLVWLTFSTIDKLLMQPANNWKRSGTDTAATHLEKVFRAIVRLNIQELIVLEYNRRSLQRLHRRTR